MTVRVLTLVVMVLLLALPHSGNRVSAAVKAMDLAPAHGVHMALDATDQQRPKRPDHHGGLTCVTICTGTPLIEAASVVAPRSGAVALWAGFGAPLSQALAFPAMPPRPPNAVVAA